MFSVFSRPPVFDLMEPHMDHTVLHADRKPRMCKDIKVRIRVGTPPKLIPFRVFFIWARPHHEGGWKCGCKLIEPTSIPVQEDVTACKRRSERVDGRFRIVSRDLPGYTAVSVDLSEGGFQMVTRAPMDTSRILDMRLEPEVEGLETLDFQARVMWCREQQRGSFRVGMEYVFPDQEQRERLGALERHLRDSRKGTISQRSIGHSGESREAVPE